MKKVLVTGGTQGVGLETVKLLLEQGYEVHITYRKSAGKAEELMQENPGRVFAHKLDQGNLEEIEKADFLLQNMNGMASSSTQRWVPALSRSMQNRAIR